MSFKLNTQNLKVLTPLGYKSFYGIQKIHKDSVHLKFNGTDLKCSKNHPLCTNFVTKTFIKASDLDVGDKVVGSSNKIFTLQEKIDIGFVDLYDLIDVEGEYMYYTNDLLSHNCVFHHKGESSIDVETFERLKQYCSDPEIMLDGESYKIWKSAEEDHIYVAGVDVAEGVGQNYSVIQILDFTDLTNIEQVAIYRDNNIAPAEFTGKLNEILTQWGKPLVLIERNSCGQIVVENLRANHQYENIVSYGAELAGRKKDFLGVIAHTNTKQRGVLNMRYWVNVLKCVKFNDMNTLIELKDFVRKANGTWSARGNGTDDCVMALVWALVMLDNDSQFGICDKYFEVESTDDNGKPSKLKAMDFGLTYFTKKDKHLNSPGAWMNMMHAAKYEDAATLPVAFGSTSSRDDDLADLEMNGWTLL
jgi:hypothetical protein